MGSLEKAAGFQRKFATAVQDGVGNILAGCYVLAEAERSGKSYQNRRCL